ncbi:hypothetical protein O9K51_08662 [Purpureocillium lavendulum]|uniref:Uncharacterized protein n=1 Tax=Purpureocillium lavendulum TaxID=1247861 RepID=A0AB34FJY5_9HYPO|nr:hypothetical protein O9K51_08662 [Purpureocillium lavendulum]
MAQNNIVPLTKLFDEKRDREIDANRMEDFLISALVNVTTTAITGLGYWNVDVNVSEHKLVTVYAFSRPLNLILPYSISLLCSLPFIIIGFAAMHENGVPAIDGGFLQLLLTTRGSKTLDALALGGSLGGERNIPEELKNVKLQLREI